jgi:flagellar export protein FliJ
MPFHFALQAVLHFRRSIEHQQELRLRSAQQQVMRVQHLIEQMDARRQELYSEQSKQLGAGVTAAELRFELQCDAELLRHRAELAAQLVRLQHQREEQRKVFQLARRGRETLESVRDRQLELYEQKAARREQQRQDDLFLLRRQYLQRG